MKISKKEKNEFNQILLIVHKMTIAQHKDNKREYEELRKDMAKLCQQ